MNALKDLGILRIILIAIAILLALFSTAPGTPAARSGWEMIPSLVLPALTPIVFMVLLFDFMMCRIRMSDEAVRKKFANISYIEIATALFMFLMWLPFFLAIGR